ncbi:MAG: hypothetical protein WC772_06630 [Candidatus Margulisiibacteriota bacterium]|jgi:hypothetical protein
MEIRLESDKHKLFLSIIMVFWLVIAGRGYANETPAYIDTTPAVRTSPNYLVILVHGINSSSRFYCGKDVGGGKGENGSELINEPDDGADYGDLKGYLENNLGLKGYVYSYTFSQRDGHIDLMARELGDPNWDNKAYLEGGWLNLKNAADIAPIKTKITDTINGEKTGRGNSWFKQAREDFIAWFSDKKKNINNPTGRPPTEAEIPHKYILVSHSLGGSSNNVHRVSLSGMW